MIGLIELALFLAVVVGVTMLLYGLLGSALAERRARRPGAWRLEERSDGELARTLRAVRRGDEPLLLGSVPIAAADFDTRIYEHPRRGPATRWTRSTLAATARAAALERVRRSNSVRLPDPS